ncbi:MAG: DUF4278 domain-containing protein [Cyanobacteria bacterium P01_A01_bin.84]
MRLTYRGVVYEYSPISYKPVIGETGGSYRGQHWRRNQATHIKMNRTTAQLKYRGLAYYIGKPQEVEQLIKQKRRFFVINKREKIEDKLAETHLSNICRNLEYRLQVAKEKGDTRLVHLLEDEAKQIAC